MDSDLNEMASSPPQHTFQAKRYPQQLAAFGHSQLDVKVQNMTILEANTSSSSSHNYNSSLQNHTILTTLPKLHKHRPLGPGGGGSGNAGQEQVRITRKIDDTGQNSFGVAASGKAAELFVQNCASLVSTGSSISSGVSESSNSSPKSPPKKLHSSPSNSSTSSGSSNAAVSKHALKTARPKKFTVDSSSSSSSSSSSGSSTSSSSSSSISEANEKMDSLLTSEVSSSSAASPNDMVEAMVKELEEDEILDEMVVTTSQSSKSTSSSQQHQALKIQNSTGQASVHNHSDSSSSDDDDEELLRDVKECQAPCHHKCKIGVACTRHGAKILAKIKRKAEKAAQEKAAKAKQYSNYNDGSSMGLNSNNHHIQLVNHHSLLNSQQQQMVQQHHHQKPPPIKSVVPPAVPKHQQNGENVLRELMFIDTCNSMPGTRKQSFFKRYKLFSVIGIGGGGTVYAGRRIEDNIPIAIKRVMRTKVKRWEKTRDGRTVPQEIALMIRASGHIGIMTLYDWFETVESFLLVLERPEQSIDLFDFIRECGPLNENIARHVILHVINAIQHLHMCGIVHRDIKDENVVLDRISGVCKLIDFGCGTNYKDSAYTEFSGTAEFYPPEWFSQRRYWAMSATVWSLGVLLFDMLQGEIPFKNSDRILENRPLFKEPISGEARQLLRWMLCNDYRKRPSLVQILEHVWMKDYVQNYGLSHITSF